MVITDNTCKIITWSINQSFPMGMCANTCHDMIDYDGEDSVINSSTCDKEILMRPFDLLYNRIHVAFTVIFMRTYILNFTDFSAF